MSKMSKSLGNFVTVHDLVKEIDPQVLRFFMATTQYRRPIRYSEATMKDAQANLQKNYVLPLKMRPSVKIQRKQRWLMTKKKRVSYKC